MFLFKFILLLSAIFAFCESAAVLSKITKKCSLTDDECLKGLYHEFLQEIADNGLPEFGVPKMDPATIDNMEFEIIGMLKLTLKQGIGKGFKSCEMTAFKNDIANYRNKIDLVCHNLSFEGDYVLESTPNLLALIGINIHGEGHGGGATEQLHTSFDFAYEIKKLDDGELHIVVKPEDSTFEFDVKGKTTLHANNIYVGSQEISTVLVNIFNENSEFIVNHFGKVTIEQSLDLFYKNIQAFFNSIPAKELITDDLTPHVKS